MSDLFENVHGKYDTIIFNPPYLPVERESPQWSGGKDGFAVTGRFLETAHEKARLDNALKDEQRAKSKLIEYEEYTKKT